MERPDGGILGPIFMGFGDADFRCFGSFDRRAEHPDVSHLDSLFVEMTADGIGRRRLFESVDSELTIHF